MEFRQVCAIARVVIEADPTISDSEWKAGTKDLAARQGYDSIPPDMLARALTQVEQALERIWGQRPAGQLTPTSEAPSRPQQDPPWSHPRGRSGMTSLSNLIERLKASGPSAPPSSTSRKQPVRNDAVILRRTECQKAAKILAQGIVEQIQRCEDAERAVEDLER